MGARNKYIYIFILHSCQSQVSPNIVRHLMQQMQHRQTYHHGCSHSPSASQSLLSHGERFRVAVLVARWSARVHKRSAPPRGKRMQKLRLTQTSSVPLKIPRSSRFNNYVSTRCPKDSQSHTRASTLDSLKPGLLETAGAIKRKASVTGTTPKQCSVCNVWNIQCISRHSFCRVNC